MKHSIVYHKQGRFIQTIFEYTKILYYFHLEQAYYYRALVLNEVGAFPSAIMDFTKTIEIYPNHKGAYHRRAFAYFKLKEYDKACMDERKAEELGGVIDFQSQEILKKCQR